MKNILINISGYYCIAFAVFHLSFWKIFRWKTDLQRLTPVNRAIIQVLNVRLTYIFVVFGFMALLFSERMCETELGWFILIAMSIFWFMRAVEQVIFFGLKNFASRAIFVVFLIGGILFAAPVYI